MKPVSKRENQVSPQPTSVRSKQSPIIQKLYRESSLSNQKGTLFNRTPVVSPSPVRRVDPKISEESALTKEFEEYKNKQKKLSEKIQSLRQLCVVYKSKIMKQQSEINFRNARLENEINKIISVFVECVGKKTVQASFGFDRSKSTDETKQKKTV